MKKGQIVKIVLEDNTTVIESIRKITDRGFSTQHYNFEKGKTMFHPLQKGVVGCALLNKTTLLHKLTLGIF